MGILVARLWWFSVMALARVWVKGHLSMKRNMLKFKSNEVLKNQNSGKNEKDREKEKAAKTGVSQTYPP